MLTVLIPSHNEGTPGRKDIERSALVETLISKLSRRWFKPRPEPKPQIAETLRSLNGQTIKPDRIIVIADNCTDDTAELALVNGAEVFATVNNRQKKAGALNQWFCQNLPSLQDKDKVMVMDADSTLKPDFLENALNYHRKGYSAVGGVFLGKSGGGFIGMLQRNEYARYARDVARKEGKTLVLTGTACVFSVALLRDVVNGRQSGKIPGTGKVSFVYDTKALTEDNELTFAVLHLGYKIIAPIACGLETEVMESWRSLWRQRYRWKRGAIENNVHYGLTRYTAKYWGLQIWGFLGIMATAAYLTMLTFDVLNNDVHIRLIWMIVTLVYVVERSITVAGRGKKQMLIAASLAVEMPYDMCLQAVHLWAIITAVLKTRKNW